MKQFKIQKIGEFLPDFFKEQIDLALQKIKDENNLPGFDKEMIKNEKEPAINFGEHFYSGIHMIYLIKNYSKEVGKLHCFFSTDRTYLNIWAIAL